MRKSDHQEYIKLALQLAEKGRYTVSPNPMVGCVIVNDEVIVGQGYHQKAGEPHAEVLALKEAREKSFGATAYITLEPCCHYGRTPPCTDALIQAGIKKVIVCCEDPNPLVAGKGFQILKNAGIEVEFGLMEKEAVSLNEIFFHYIQTKKPFVIAKWAMSLDGKTVTHHNDSPNISSQESREYSHEVRQQVDAILIGSKTAVRDNPQLTVRYAVQNNKVKQPIRIVLSGKGDLPLDLKLFDKTCHTIVVTINANTDWINTLQSKNIEVIALPENNSKINLNDLLTCLGEKKITSLLIEGGMNVLHEFFNENLVNKIHVYLAPNIIGSLNKKRQLTNVSLSNINQDYFITADY